MCGPHVSHMLLQPLASLQLLKLTHQQIHLHLPACSSNFMLTHHLPRVQSVSKVTGDEGYGC